MMSSTEESEAKPPDGRRRPDSVTGVIRTYFEAGKEGRFADLLEVAGGPQSKFAVKAATNKLRKEGKVELRNGIYRPKK